MAVGEAWREQITSLERVCLEEEAGTGAGAAIRSGVICTNDDTGVVALPLPFPTRPDWVYVVDSTVMVFV